MQKKKMKDLQQIETLLDRWLNRIPVRTQIKLLGLTEKNKTLKEVRKKQKEMVIKVKGRPRGQIEKHKKQAGR